VPKRERNAHYVAPTEVLEKDVVVVGLLVVSTVAVVAISDGHIGDIG